MRRTKKNASRVPGKPAAAPARSRTAGRGPAPIVVVEGDGLRERRSTSVSILVAEMRGLDGRAQSAKGRLPVALRNAYMEMMADTAVLHGATIANVWEGGLVLLFGVARANDADPLSAVRAGLDIQRGSLSVRNAWMRTARRSTAVPGICVAVATGDISLRKTRLGRVPAFSVAGAPLTRAARLTQTGRGGEIRTDAATQSRCAGELDSEAVFSRSDADFRLADCVHVYRCQARRARLRVLDGRSSTDPVCGAALDFGRAVRRKFGDRTFYFCSCSCADRFLGDPESFLAAHSS